MGQNAHTLPVLENPSQEMHARQSAQGQDLIAQELPSQKRDNMFLSDKHERIFKNIVNKIYEPKVTQIMKYERVGYKQAKAMLDAVANI